MRRLVKHGIAGVGFAAFTVTAAVAALGSPASQDLAIAVPAPQTSVVAYSVAPPDPALAAEAAARADRESRDVARAKLTAAATQQAVKRASTLGKQSKSIAAQQKKIKADKAKAKTKAQAAAKAKAEAAEAAEAARQRAIKNRGYEPGTTDPREIARQILKNKYDYGDEQYSCFNYIIMRESKWDIDAENPSGAYGIPQALPGRKMASAGSDWRTNPATQIIWAIGYMKDRYGSPCSAKGFKASHGWY